MEITSELKVFCFILEEKRRAESPSYQMWLTEQQQLEDFQNEENERIRVEKHRLWLLEEEAARERWLKQQQRLERLKAEKAKQELLIREEWEREQRKLELEAAKREEERENRKREQTELLNRIEMYVLGETENLPSSARTATETQPGCEPCPFFSKVAACRFRDACSRNHLKPSVSRTLVIPNFYSHFRMEHVSRNNEYDTDLGLEYDDREIYDHFLEFYDDVLSELKKFGTVTQFKVCCNEEPHLRGNVYVQYQSERSAIKAFRVLQGRFYGGKRVSAEFCNIPSWSKALCEKKTTGVGLLRLFANSSGVTQKATKTLPKGDNVGVIHVIRLTGRQGRHRIRRENVLIPAQSHRDRIVCEAAEKALVEVVRN
ncbi:hypothetical protein V9T40_000046 [Parthenolecanium corni]|uniref:Uncharacterized protein n=1 Tax=Parthenolecanium corni TaxID=536013 RepID=A0AAN9TG64_9HEMI